MRLAVAKAKEGIQKGQSPFAACIVKEGKVIACEHNSVWRSSDITAHAEMNSIRSACRRLGSIDLSGCTIYSTCEPCPMCFSACHWARIARIVYGSRIADAQKSGFHELTIPALRMKKLGRSRISARGGVLRKENLELFAIWSRQPQARTY